MNFRVGFTQRRRVVVVYLVSVPIYSAFAVMSPVDYYWCHLVMLAYLSQYSWSYLSPPSHPSREREEGGKIFLDNFSEEQGRKPNFSYCPDLSHVPVLLVRSGFKLISVNVAPCCTPRVRLNELHQRRCAS